MPRRSTAGCALCGAVLPRSPDGPPRFSVHFVPNGRFVCRSAADTAPKLLETGNRRRHADIRGKPRSRQALPLKLDIRPQPNAQALIRVPSLPGAVSVMVDDGRGRLEDHSPAASRHAKTPLVVLSIEVEALIERPDRQAHRAFDKQ